MASKPKKSCPMCCADVASLRVSPGTCSGGHGPDQRACYEYWEAYLSKEVEEQRPEDITCIFEHDGISIIDKKDLADLARKETLERYEEKLNSATYFCCQNRCWASKRDPNERTSPSVSQPHSRQKDGRVFACKFCDFETCIDCDRLEHDGESCAEYRARVMDLPQHIQNDEATAANLNRCPSCAAFWDWDDRDSKKCGCTRCEACKYRLCGNCLVPWAGENSAHLLGKTAHARSCRYHRKLAESKYALRNRFEPDEETKVKLTEKEEQKKMNRETKEEEKRKAMEDKGENEADDTVRAGKVFKKQRHTAEWKDAVAL